MEAKDKARELVHRFGKVEIMFEGQIAEISYDEMCNAAKQCALKCVDEIIEAVEDTEPNGVPFVKWWKSVKTEIEKL